jgi:hypothetical protein
VTDGGPKKQHDAPNDVESLDLSDEERAASEKGLSPPASTATDPPPHDHIRAVALRLLWIFGVCLIAIIGLATVIACLRPGSLKDMIGFFGTVIATLGTLLGGVVAFYFSRH